MVQLIETNVLINCIIGSYGGKIERVNLRKTTIRQVCLWFCCVFRID